MKKKTLEELIVAQREINDQLDGFDSKVQKREELTDDEKSSRAQLLQQFEANKREIGLLLQEKQAKTLVVAPKKDINTELHEFFREAKPGQKFIIPMTREAISYGSQGVGQYQGTDGFVQGITVVDLIPTDRPDGDILSMAGVPMVTGVTGNKIQWAYAGGVEAVFANELATTTERVIDLDKQTPIQQRLTIRVRISNQAIENSDFDLHAYIVRAVMGAIRNKINWALASTTKATDVFYGPFAQNAEVGTYGTEGYTPGKQVGTYTKFTKDTAAEMIGKLASHNLKTDSVVFVMGSEEYWRLKVTPFDEGSGLMLIDKDNRLLGIPVVENNAINRASEKGAISGHSIGLGAFKYVPTMQHGNIRLSVDGTSALAANTDELITTINADFSMTVLKDGADAFVLYTKNNDSSSDI